MGTIKSFIKQRLDKTEFTGLTLTILGIAFLYALLLLYGAVSGFTTSDIIASADTRVNTLLYTFRNATTVKTFIWITLLGEKTTIIVFALAASALLWLGRKKWQIITLWITIIGSEGFTFITKLLFNRPRPINAVFLENSASFPSGHAAIAVAFYGFLAYLLLQESRSATQRALLIISSLLLMLGIGFSRLYLGVHYFSDVWTGYLIGLLWLIIGISVNELKLSQKQGD